MHNIWNTISFITLLFIFLLAIIVFSGALKINIETNCIWCLLFGHKWWLTTKNDVKKGDQMYRNIEHIKTTHCQRCGEPNPDKTEIKTKEI